jgi:nucleoid-associated protein YgaU
MKSFTKLVIGFLAFNAIMANLKQEGVVSGQITVNYPKLIQKVSENIGVRFVDSDEAMYPQNSGVRYVENNFDDLPVYSEQDQSERLEDIFTDLEDETFHIVQDGETLISLSSIYGVSWESIRETNHIADVRRLHPGQKLVIPAS